MECKQPLLVTFEYTYYHKIMSDNLNASAPGFLVSAMGKNFALQEHAAEGPAHRWEEVFLPILLSIYMKTPQMEPAKGPN